MKDYKTEMSTVVKQSGINGVQEKNENKIYTTKVAKYENIRKTKNTVGWGITHGNRTQGTYTLKSIIPVTTSGVL